MKLCAAASTQHRKRKLHKNKLPLATGLYKPAAIFDKLDPFLPATLFQTGVKSRSLLSSIKNCQKLAFRAPEADSLKKVSLGFPS